MTMEIKLELSDSLVEVVVEAQPARQSWLLHAMTASVFVASHCLLLAQLLALDY